MNFRAFGELVTSVPDLLDAYRERVHFKATVDHVRHAAVEGSLTDELLVEILLRGLASASNDYQSALDHAINVAKMTPSTPILLARDEPQGTDS